MVRHRSICLFAAAAAVLSIAGCDSSKSRQSPATPSPTSIRPADFVARVDNPYFPLRPGTTLRYRGIKDGKPALDVFAVTHETRRIMGVPCVVVRDELFRSGRLVEQTVDWYTQDRRGNVWYFGEATRELDARGRTTSTEGSWQAGVAGARPGIYMPARPRVGDSFQQELLNGHAEDYFQILDLRASVTVPFGSYPNRALRTKEWTPLEPGAVGNKYYVRGVGQVKEAAVTGPAEALGLVSVTRG
jgi:hypothetical protein